MGWRRGRPLGLVHTQCRSPRDIWPLGVERGCDACDSVFGCKSYGLYRERDVLVRLLGYSYLLPWHAQSCTSVHLSPLRVKLTALAIFFRFLGHGNTSTTARVYINTTRSDHRNALPPRRRVSPGAASSSRAARACCAGRCLVSYIRHSLWFPAQAPDIVGLLPRDPAECPSIPRQLYM